MRFPHRVRRPATPTERLRAVRVLPAEAGSIPLLLDALDDPSADIVREALDRLAAVAGPTEAGVLRARLLGVDLAVLRDWAAALRRIGDAPASIAVAAAGLRAEDTATRLTAAIALGELGDRAAVPPLAGALRDAIAGVRRSALLSLARLGGPPETGRACARMLYDVDDGVRAAAVEALTVLSRRLDEDLRPALDDPSVRVRRQLGDHAALLQPQGVGRLLADSNPDVRAAAAWSAARHPRPDLAPTLVAHLADPAWEVRRALCRAIGATGDRSAVRALVPVLADRNPTVRAAALNVLSELPGDEFGALIAGSLPAASARVRRALVYALFRCPEGLRVPILAASAADPDTDVRLAVAHVAAGVADVRAAGILALLAEDSDPAVRHAATSATMGAAGWSSRRKPPPG